MCIVHVVEEESEINRYFRVFTPHYVKGSSKRKHIC